MTTVQTQIVSNEAIHAGEPVIGGTATPVRAVAELWNQGMPAEEMPAHLAHLTLAQVFDALSYYLTHRDLIDAHIAANRIPDGWTAKRFDPQSGKVI